MQRPSVAVVFTGGTISTLMDPVRGGAVPALDGAAILARTPGLESVANVVAVDRGLTPASHFTFAALLALSRTIAELARDPKIQGIVVVQGTDTIEETSFFFDLLHDSDKPVVVTGSMRNASEPDYEGPENLQNAVAVAASTEMRAQGVVVALDGSIDPADDVTKTHTTARDTFKSLNSGRIGCVTGGEVRVERPRGRRRAPLPGAVPAEPVFLVKATVAMDARLLGAAASLGARGLVVEATGAGNTSPELLGTGKDAIAAGIPVVLTSRCASGAPGPYYAFPGGGAEWVKSGALLAGTLSGPKARIALALGLGAGLRGDALSRVLSNG